MLEGRMLRAARSRLIAGGFCFLAAAGVAKEDAPVMDFAPSAPGTYRLQHIQPAADGSVLDTRGRMRRLAEFTRGRITLLSFMYSSCNDPGGCPYAFLVLHRVKEALEALPSARKRVRLISLSFDPERDTPAVMALYAGKDAEDRRGIPWEFLTTGSDAQLLPILDGYGQDLWRVTEGAGGPSTGRFAHVLKVFLVDRKGTVREIYTTEYLLPEVVINDIKTLLLEDGVKLE